MVSHDTSMLAMAQIFVAVATKDEEQISNPLLSQTANKVFQDTM